MMKLRKGLAAAGLIRRLSFSTTPKTAEEVTEFALSSEIIKPLQVKRELQAFASVIAELCPRTVLEIGTCRGGTLFVFSRLSDPQAKIISIDLPRGDFGGGYKWFQVPILKAFARKGQAIHLLREDSHHPTTKKKVAALLNGQDLDLLFIDGDHSYEGAKADFEMYGSFVKNGIIALHDVAKHPASSGAQVSVLWEELKQKFEHREIVEDPCQGWAGIGLIYIRASNQELRSRNG